MLRLLVALLPALLVTARLVAATGGFCPPSNAGFCKPRGGLFMGTEIRCDITEGRIEFYTPGCEVFSHFIPKPTDLATYPCRAYAGMNVSVRCGSSLYIEEGGRELFVDGERANVSDDGVFLIANLSVGDEALLECRDGSGFVTASRNLSVIGDVRVAGVSTNCGLFYCDVDYQCCRTSRDTRLSYSTDYEEYVAPISHFVVVGESPSLSWDVVWLNHYPVHLELEITDDSYYNNSRAKVLYLRNGWPERISATPRALIRVTASNGYSNHTICFGVSFETNFPTVTVNESLIRNTTVEANSDAEFHCQLGYIYADGASHSISIFLFPSPQSFLKESRYHCNLDRSQQRTNCSCQSCDFTVTFTATINSVYSSFFYTVTLHKVALNDSGTVVSFSYIRRSYHNSPPVTQWQGNATLTVTPFIISPSTTEVTTVTGTNTDNDTDNDRLSKGVLLVVILVSLLVVVIATVTAIAGGVWLVRKRKSSSSESSITYTALGTPEEDIYI